MATRSMFKFRLYIAEGSQNSMHAVSNLNALCEAHLPGQYDIEIIDVFTEPLLALADAVYMTPTLLRLAPHPVRRIVGTLSHQETVMHALGLKARETA